MATILTIIAIAILGMAIVPAVKVARAIQTILDGLN